MDYRPICAGMLSLSACVLDPQPVGPPPELSDAPLVGFDGEARLEQQTSDSGVRGVVLRLSRQDLGCALLSPSTTVTLDGVAGEIYRGGYDLGDGEWPHNDDGCIAPHISWANNIAATSGTIVLTDGETTWRFQVDQPFVPRTFEVISPATTSVRSGDQVVLEMTPATDELSLPSVAIFTSTGHETLYGNSGLTQTGTTVAFTMPTVAATEQVLVRTTALASMKILACDLPGGCKAVINPSSDMTLEVAP